MTKSLRSRRLERRMCCEKADIDVAQKQKAEAKNVLRRLRLTRSLRSRRLKLRLAEIRHASQLLSMRATMLELRLRKLARIPPGPSVVLHISLNC